MIDEQLQDWLVNPLALLMIVKLPFPHSEVFWNRHAHRVQVAVDASLNIILLNIELVALKVDLETHGIDAQKSSFAQRRP